ncbi:MAG: penicillin-binding protein 2 [Pyrinomonadaceae bacterium MAG19_C2-C3]|nr:penicillin-binding protein 2 [Pyrinomonadaceae bacterium MAG19_C2-C3]
MKFQDESQNLRARLVVLQLGVLLLLGVLGVRLYLLQIVRGAHYAEMAENQRIRLLPVPAPRGVIFDRNGKVLVDSTPIYNIIMSREDVRNYDLDTLVEPLSAGLGIDPDFLRERFEEIKTQPQFESVKVKEGATPADIAWVEAHALEHSELRIEAQPQRRYPADGTLAHVLGYVSEISRKQLDEPAYQARGLKMGDTIGKEGLEQTYDHLLRGRDGYRKVLVNSRGQIQETIETVAPQPGQDLVTTIDLEMQRAAEERLRTSPSKRGVIVAMNPNNGEILALASYPTFDPNLFTQRITTREGRREYAALITDKHRPLYNRAIRGRYPPGSTWKIPMAMAGLMQGSISIKHSEIACGGGITIGNKFTRCMSQHGTPELRYAIEKSCDGYFYRLGLKMGLEGIEKMVDDFDINKRTGIDLPHELISWTPSREFKRKWNKADPEWRDIDTVYASFGQVYDIVTPMAMLRAVAGIGVGGTLQVPHLFKEARAVYETPAFAARPLVAYQSPAPKVVPIAEDQHHFVVEGMWNVVNRAGTGRGIKMENFEIAGKTGTAQVAALGKDVGDNKDHSWFVSHAPAYKPEIAMIALIENVGFGGTYAAPASRAVYDVYYRETRGEEVTETELAKK